MDKVFLIRNEEVYDFEEFHHKTRGFKNHDDAKREFDALKESIKNEYKGEIESGWIVEESETQLQIYQDGEYPEYHHCIFIEEIEVN